MENVNEIFGGNYREIKMTDTSIRGMLFKFALSADKMGRDEMLELTIAKKRDAVIRKLSVEFGDYSFFRFLTRDQQRLAKSVASVGDDFYDALDELDEVMSRSDAFPVPDERWIDWRWSHRIA